MISSSYAVFLRAAYKLHRRSSTNTKAKTGTRLVLGTGLSILNF